MYERAGTIHHLVRIIKEAGEGVECAARARGQKKMYKKKKNDTTLCAREISCWLPVDKIQPVLFKNVFEVIGLQLFFFF